MNTSSKEWRQALQLRAISFLVLWSLSQSNSPTKGNMKLITCRALQVCTTVLYCSFGLLACATEILPSCVLVSSYFYSLLVYGNTRHAHEHFKKSLQALQLRAISFLVLWSLPQSNSHNEGNINLRTRGALHVCRIVLYCSFAFLACATEILPSCVLVNNSFTFF